ncbi:MAG: HlyD family efflux transporter periplasmic adaptor subunit [bacterium]|nr:HlyD family efflux transporter periplasmic adaptor subunit [bacterium]
MGYIEEKHGIEIDEIAENIDRIKRFSGPPADFWPAFLEWSAQIAGANLGLLLVKGPEDGSWKSLFMWPSKHPDDPELSKLQSGIAQIADTAALKGHAWFTADSDDGNRGPVALLGARLKIEAERRMSVAVFLLDNNSESSVQEAATRLLLVVDTPMVYQMAHVVSRAKLDVAQFSEALDLMVLMNEEQRYLGAAMAFCNEIASRYRCERTSLGWLEGAYVRLQAISHMERFEKKMEAVQSLEAAMEEAFDQDEEILWPRPQGSIFVVRDHEAFSREHGASHIVSVPIRLDEDPAGVLTCERSVKPFSVDEVRGLRILCDQAARRLGDLKKYDRWFGARMASSFRDLAGKILGVEHTFAKLMTLIVSAALIFMIFGKLDYRVEAPFMLKTDDLAYQPAPFDGYIHDVHVKVGDRVAMQAPLLSLDTRELLLEESQALANQNRYMREAEKARSQKALADMKIALALQDQATAQLKLVRYHIAHAQVQAPFAGIVVEGDLKELLGAPVRKGEILFKVALLAEMFAELKVDERDIHEIGESDGGEIAFVSRPDLKFPIKVERIDPVAAAEEEGNVFTVRAVFPQDVVNWWRPGMSGVAKIDVGRRNILWILTHRTIDFLRILVWW